MDRWKAEQGRGREKRKIRREKIRRERVRKKEDADARKGRKVAKHCVFPMICGSGGSKSRLAKAAGAEPAGHRSDEKLHAVVREAHFEVKMYKTHHSRTTFGSWDVEKVHAVVAQSTFWSKNAQSTSVSDDFWKLRCRKSARRCGAKHISKWKCTKHTILGPLLEVEMSKKCTPLWREAHFEVKMHKTPQCRTTFGSWDVEKVHAVVARSTFWSQKCQKLTVSDHFWRFGCRKSVEKVHAVVARSTFRSENAQNTPFSDHFWKLRCRKSARRCGAKHILKSKCTKHLSVGRLLEVEMSKKCTPLWREAHFEVKSVKDWGFWAFFDVKMSKK